MVALFASRTSRRTSPLPAEAAREQLFQIQPQHRRDSMSLLLADVCRRDSTGPEPMLSALVVNGSSRKPSDQFFELAVTEFHRRDPDWTWEWERDAVFDRYHSPVSP